MLPPVGGGVADESGTVEGVLGAALGDVGAAASGVVEFGLTSVPGCVVPGVVVEAPGVLVVELGV
jgi:hypothetical protein